MNQLFKFGLILSLICFIATLVLAVTYQITSPKIEEQKRIEEKEALQVVMPQAASFGEEKSVDGIDYFEAFDQDKKLLGYCVKTVGTGYSGFIRMMVGLDRQGTIEGLEVLEQQETPGLGARIEEVRPGEKDAWFLRQFNGKKSADIELRKDISAITGATISSKAVVSAVKKTAAEFLSKVGK